MQPPILRWLIYGHSRLIDAQADGPRPGAGVAWKSFQTNSFWGDTFLTKRLFAILSSAALVGSIGAFAVPRPQSLDHPHPVAGNTEITAEDMLAMGEAFGPLPQDTLAFPAGLPLVGRDGAVTLYDGSGLSARVDGPRVTMSSPAISPISVNLERVGREANLRPTPPRISSSQDDSVTWTTYGTESFSFSEYWRVDRGIEHGYFLNKKPAGSGSLVFEISVDGADATQDGSSVTLTANNGSQLNWGQLMVWDSLGETLPSEFVAMGSSVQITVDDSDAHYPVLIDPTFTQEARLIASDGADGDNFGRSVAIDGDTAVVGAWDANSGKGYAYVYVRDGSTWSEQAILGENKAYAEFGEAVAIDGDVIVIGDSNAIYNGDDGPGVYGVAHIYTRTGTTWTHQKTLKASDEGDGHNFGVSVAVSGQTVVVGAEDADSNANGDGAVYVYTGANWSTEAILGGSEADDEFGDAVAIDGNTIVVGDPEEDTNGLTDAGAVHVYAGSGSSWTLQASLDAGANAVADGVFGDSVDISGNTIVVGAPGDDADDAGEAYVFTRSNSTWTQQARLTASNATNGDNFGFSVGVSGDNIVVGAWDESTTASSSGAAYIFNRSGATWTEQKLLKASAVANGEEFGFSVGISGDRIIVGDTEENYGGPNGFGGDEDQGAAYLFRIIPDTPEPRQRELGEPGIFLTLHGSPGERASGRVVEFGAFSAGARAPVVFSLTTETGTTSKRMLFTGALDAKGNLEKSLNLPQLAAGTYSLMMSSKDRLGNHVVLTNRFTVDASDYYVSVTPERLQPVTR